MSPEEPTTEQLRAIFAERAGEEAERAEDASEDEAQRAHARRAEKASYLEEKLAEQAEADRE
jgi:hypothetical protein